MIFDRVDILTEIGFPVEIAEIIIYDYLGFDPYIDFW
jgi:hypothetical protein